MILKGCQLFLARVLYVDPTSCRLVTINLEPGEAENQSPGPWKYILHVWSRIAPCRALVRGRLSTRPFCVYKVSIVRFRLEEVNVPIDKADSYRDVMLRELYARRSALQKDLAEIDQTISGITKFFGETLAPTPQQRTVIPATPHGMMPIPPAFATMSARWAILHLLDRALTEYSDGALSTGEITKVLIANGKTSDAKRFENNVSATLNNMKGPRVEVDQIEGKWKITPNGRSAIQHIRYKNRSLIWDVQINWSCLDSAKSETPDVLAPGATN